MTTPIGAGTAVPKTATTTAAEDPNFKASSKLVDGKFALTEDDPTAQKYMAFVLGLGESHSASVTNRVESKMTDWIKANPNADQKAYESKLGKTLMMESLVQNEIKNGLQKFMNDIMNKMKEMAADRFS